MLPLSRWSFKPLLSEWQFTSTVLVVPKVSYIIAATKYPASAAFASTIASDASGDLVTLSNFFDHHTIGETLPFPSINTMNPPCEAPVDRFACDASLYTLTFHKSGFPRSRNTSFKPVLLTLSTVLFAVNIHLMVGDFP